MILVVWCLVVLILRESYVDFGVVIRSNMFSFIVSII